MTKTFPEVIVGVRTAKKGVEVREDLAQMAEYCQQFTEQAGKQADAARDAAEGYANSAKESQEKAAQTVQGIDQTKADAIAAVQQAQATATQAVEDKQTAAESAVNQAQTGAVQAVDDAKTAALQEVATSTEDAANAAQAANASKEAAAGSASTALNAAGASAESATAAAGSASAAATSESNAATSAGNANADAARAEAAAQKAEATVSADKTLTIPGAPADAAAVGEALGKKAGAQETEDALAERYTKTEMDDKLDGKLGLHDTADNATKWAGTALRLNHNTSDTYIPVFSENNTQVDYTLTDEIAGRNGVAASGNDYIRFTDGTQICWGRADLVYGKVMDSVDITITFPQPFSDYCVPTFAYHWSWYTEKIHTTSVYKTNMTVCGINIQQNDHLFYWIAIGRWK